MDDIGDEDFLLAIQTEFQHDIMQAFGNNIICVDSTHETNMYDFFLITVLIADEFGEGTPVAWAISNREDGCILRHFSKNLHDRTKDLKSIVFMSDNAQQYWNSWSAVYGKNNTKTLLCKWHIDRAWRKALNEFVSNKEERIKIYHYLQLLLTEYRTTV